MIRAGRATGTVLAYRQQQSQHMLYRVELTDPELALLGSLSGNRIEELATNGWSAEIRTSTRILHVRPEEVATPDDQHPCGSVERPHVELVASSMLGDHVEFRENELGVVRNIWILSTLISFSPPVDCPPEEILAGVTLPASTGYGWVYYSPEDWSAVRQSTVSQHALISLDVAVELITEVRPSVLLYTRGYFVGVSLDGLPDEDWVRFGAFSKRDVSSAC